MDKTDRRILNKIQGAFPVTAEPFRVLGTALGLDPPEVLRRARAMKAQGIIRRIGAVFDLRRLGFTSTLCAARVPEGKVPSFVAAVNACPGVTHNYRRNHAFNIWFTLIAPDREALEAILQEIRAQTGVEDILAMDALHTFKINATFEV